MHDHLRVPLAPDERRGRETIGFPAQVAALAGGVETVPIRLPQQLDQFRDWPGGLGRLAVAGVTAVECQPVEGGKKIRPL